MVLAGRGEYVFSANRTEEKTMDALLSIDEAARKLGGLSKYTIHAWLSKGKLTRTKVGSRTMIRESDLAAVIVVDGKSPRRKAGEGERHAA